MSVEKPEENSMDGLEETTPLSDVRRTRTRSTGRPPSQHFLKEHSFNRTVSIECEDPPNQRQQTLSDSNDSILDEVLEITQKKMEDKETADTTKKINSVVIQPKQIVKEEIPWMKEFLKKKERKRSLLEDEKKSIEEFVKNDESNRRIKGTAYEFIKNSSFGKFDKERNIEDDGGKNQKPAGVRQKTEDATTTDENIITRSKMVVSETNSEKFSSFAETHQVATTTESSSSIHSVSKRFNIESHSKKPVELPRADLTKTETSKIETIKAGLNISNITSPISPPKLPIPTNDVEDQTDKFEKIDEKNSNKIQIQELLLKIKNFEETANKRLKNIRNELKVLHREVASQSEYVTEFVKTLENDLASIINAD